jgi:hypothetical protein
MKRWFEPLENLNVDDQPFVTDTDDLLGFTEWSFREGKAITRWNCSAWVGCSDRLVDGHMDDVLRNHLGLPIFSAKLEQALTFLGIEGIQFLPLQILRPNNTFVTGYSLANVLNYCPALDMQSSLYDVFIEGQQCGRISSLQKIVLKGNGIVDKDIIRLAEFPIIELVSEVFVQAYRTFGCTGYIFKEVETV